MTQSEINAVRKVVRDLMNADYDNPRNQMIHPVIAGAVMTLVGLLPDDKEKTDEEVQLSAL